MSKIDRTKRPRRIAADEAHAWARNLRLGNHHAKSVLRSLSLYVDGDGWCFVGIEQLADDCELSPDTVRRRLVWLEEIGAVVRKSQWLDEKGCRNGDGRGKRTSDLIRMMVEADTAIIEARARGEEIDDDDGDIGGISPSSQQGLNPAAEPVSPAPALRQPSQSCDHLNSEPEPESSPLPPSRGRESAAPDRELEEPEHFAPAWQAWRGHEVMGAQRHLALKEFRRLTLGEQLQCRAAIGPYNALLDKHRRSTVVNFHMWIRHKGFLEFPDAKLAAPPPPPPERRWVAGDELAGVLVAGAIAGRTIRPSNDPDRGPGLWTLTPPRADLSALAQFHDDKPEKWLSVDSGSAHFAAWRDRLQAWLGGDPIVGERVWTEDHDPAVHDVPPIHPNFRFRKSKRSLRVPALWPPRRDGSWAETDEGEMS